MNADFRKGRNSHAPSYSHFHFGSNSSGTYDPRYSPSPPARLVLLHNLNNPSLSLVQLGHLHATGRHGNWPNGLTAKCGAWIIFHFKSTSADATSYLNDCEAGSRKGYSVSKMFSELATFPAGNLSSSTQLPRPSLSPSHTMSLPLYKHQMWLRFIFFHHNGLKWEVVFLLCFPFFSDFTLLRIFPYFAGHKLPFPHYNNPTQAWRISQLIHIVWNLDRRRCAVRCQH